MNWCSTNPTTFNGAYYNQYYNNSYSSYYPPPSPSPSPEIGNRMGNLYRDRNLRIPSNNMYDTYYSRMYYNNCGTDITTPGEIPFSTGYTDHLMYNDPYYNYYHQHHHHLHEIDNFTWFRRDFNYYNNNNYNYFNENDYTTYSRLSNEPTLSYPTPTYRDYRDYRDFHHYHQYHQLNKFRKDHHNFHYQCQYSNDVLDLESYKSYNSSLASSSSPSSSTFDADTSVNKFNSIYPKLENNNVTSTSSAAIGDSMEQKYVVRAKNQTSNRKQQPSQSNKKHEEKNLTKLEAMNQKLNSMMTKEIQSHRNGNTETDFVPHKKKLKKSSLDDQKKIRSELKNMTPLPGFQQAFGSTEIGRFSEIFFNLPETLEECSSILNENELKHFNSFQQFGDNENSSTLEVQPLISYTESSNNNPIGNNCYLNEIMIFK